MSIARVRVELKPGVRPDERTTRMLLAELRKQCGQAGILHTYKEHQYFESESVKARRKRRQIVNKMEQATVEEKLLRGEKVKCSSKLIKKIRSRQAKAKRRAKVNDQRNSNG